MGRTHCKTAVISMFNPDSRVQPGAGFAAGISWQQIKLQASSIKNWDKLRYNLDNLEMNRHNLDII